MTDSCPRKTEFYDYQGEKLHSSINKTSVSMTGPGRRRRLQRSRVAALIMAGVVGAAACSSGGSVKAAPSGGGGATAIAQTNLAGVTINFADQLKDYTTIVQANNSLAGAPYKVNWSEFTAGPPIVAAETGGSVDLGGMAETPTIFAQAAGDPVRVVALAEGSANSVPFAIVVSPSSSITKVSELRGKTVAVQEGTTEQYILVHALQQANLPYAAVKIDNLNIVAGEAALEGGRVDAYVTSEPLTSLMVLANKARVLQGATGGTRYLQYITASQSALNDPAKRAAIVDLITRIFTAEDHDAKDPSLGVQTYVKTYGVPLAVAQKAAAAVSTEPAAITQSVIDYQQQEADAFLRLGLIPKKLVVANLFDLALNQQIMAAWNAKQGKSA
jgi:sulfonate transport system substrate-binding protein